jgi:hypothetical protein
VRIPHYDVMNDVNLLSDDDKCDTKLDDDGCESESDCIDKCDSRGDCAGFVFSSEYKGALKREFVAGCLRVRSDAGFSTYRKVLSGREAEAGKEKCNLYMLETGCGWTKELSCPGQSPGGTKGVANQETPGYECCCENGLWKSQ